ncbi:MAG: ubiquitin-like domain-containing protein [Nitriliruptorales bacterium]|nr:ubiquitin-like domain-containing protein [Nitriliruptorales bacterium]
MTSTPRSTSRARRWLLRGLVLLGIGALTLPVVAFGPRRVAVHVNGVAATVVTSAATVADLLEDEGIELAAGDLILPAPETPLDETVSVTIVRPIEVDVVVDGEQRTVQTAHRSVAGALSAAGLGAAPGATVDPPRTSLLEDGDTVTVETPRVVTVVVDGTLVPMVTLADTVGEAIAEAGIELGDKDVVQPAPSTELADGDVVTVTRIDVREETEEVVLERPTERRANSALYKGIERVVDSGADGLRIDTYRVRYRDGDEVSRELVSEEIVTEPSPRIVEYGTKPRPTYDLDDTTVWYKLAKCESNLQWHYNGPSGYDGGLQFHPDTWRNFRPDGYPDYAYEATPEQQIEVGKRVQRAYGWGAWPHCARELGLY